MTIKLYIHSKFDGVGWIVIEHSLCKQAWGKSFLAALNHQDGFTAPTIALHRVKIWWSHRLRGDKS